MKSETLLLLLAGIIGAVIGWNLDLSPAPRYRPLVEYADGSKVGIHGAGDLLIENIADGPLTESVIQGDGFAIYVIRIEKPGETLRKLMGKSEPFAAHHNAQRNT